MQLDFSIPSVFERRFLMSKHGFPASFESVFFVFDFDGLQLYKSINV